MAVRFGQLSRLAEVQAPVTIELKPLDGGMDTSRAAWDPAMRAGSVKSPFSVNTRIDNGVVGRASGLTELGSVSAATDKHIMAVAEYELLSGTKLLMRVLNDQLERWNGTAWLALSGTLNGAVNILPSVMTANDLFLIANGVDRIKKWDGGDGNAVADFSASAPKARHIAYFLGRVVAADIVNGGTRDAEEIQISDDIDNSNFSTGNSDTVILEEDSSERPSPIMGMTTLFSRLYIYRKNSIWVAQATGNPISPLAFAESTSNLGLIAPRSIGKYDPVGDIFLGTDFMVYAFSGGQKPIPVGLPVHRDMEESIGDASLVYGAVDLERHEYWLMAPIGGGDHSTLAWVWQIDPWVVERRLVWARRPLPTDMVSIGSGDIPLALDVLNNETRLLDDIPELIDMWQLGGSFKSLVLGGADGKVRYPDYTTLVDENFSTVEATHTLPQVGSPHQEIWLDTAYLEYRSPAVAQAELTFSTDGGTTFGNPRLITLPSASMGAEASVFVGLNVTDFIPRIRLTDTVKTEIIGLRFVARPRGVSR